MKAADARVLLTGASGGIGQAIAIALRQAGAEVMGVGRGDGAAGTPWARADLTTDDGVAAVTAAAADWHANVVVHAAGMPAFGPLASASSAQMQSVLQANLLAPMRLTQSMLPALLRQPRAQVVFFTSALGASKAGLHGFAEALRRELADTPVRVQILGPRSTRTRFNDTDVLNYNRATGTAMDTPETVASALVALIESEAAERFLGFPERLAVRLNGALGALLDGGFARHRRCVSATSLQPVSQGTLR